MVERNSLRLPIDVVTVTGPLFTASSAMSADPPAGSAYSYCAQSVVDPDRRRPTTNYFGTC